MSKSSDGDPAPPETTSRQDGKVPRKPKKVPANSVGEALRSAYQRTLDENIPPEMLDLLGKLG